VYPVGEKPAGGSAGTQAKQAFRKAAPFGKRWLAVTFVTSFQLQVAFLMEKTLSAWNRRHG
jgi:hypothetical protein